MADPTTELADDRLVISLDFGTTFSGVAYAFNIPGKKADVVSILDWPGKSYQIATKCAFPMLSTAD